MLKKKIQEKYWEKKKLRERGPILGPPLYVGLTILGLIKKGAHSLEIF
jgi:hypothetical protein